MTVSTVDRRRRLSVGINAAVLVVVMAVVALIALPASQTAPPAIAELAPNAQEQIQEAPPDQASSSGEGDGGVGGDGIVTTTTTSTTVPPSGERAIDRGRVRRCVGNPPRQTEDPQSPPCVPYFEGDNGGATWKGVTRDEVRVAIASNYPYAQRFAQYFNSRYEFYGRKIVPVDTGCGGTAEEMIATAVKVDTEIEAFASTHCGDAGGREFAYYDELARRQIVSVNGRPSMASEKDLARHHPYQWSYLPTFDVMTRNKAEWICKALKGKPPEFAGGSERAAAVRKFALVVTVGNDGSRPDVGPMKSILRDCGVDLSGQEYEFVMYTPGDDRAGLQQAQDLMIKLQTSGVTSIICECHTQSSGFYSSPVATKQGYFPEWLIGTYMYQAEDTHVQFNEGQQQEHSFGLGWWDKQLPIEQTPFYIALRDVDPNFTFNNVFEYYDARFLYNTMRVLAAGIQAAGPRLTPETFGNGLQRARFPDPGAGGPPYWQATVSFTGDHSFVDDAAIVWASKSQPSVWGNVPGAICYARRGARYRFGTWPSDNAGLFQQPCY